MALKLYALIGVASPPVLLNKRLPFGFEDDASGSLPAGTQFVSYFQLPASTPSMTVFFTGNAKEVPLDIEMVAYLTLCDRLPKRLGVLQRDAKAFQVDLAWTSDEQAALATMDAEARLAKLVVRAEAIQIICQSPPDSACASSIASNSRNVSPSSDSVGAFLSSPLSSASAHCVSSDGESADGTAASRKRSYKKALKSSASSPSASTAAPLGSPTGSPYTAPSKRARLDFGAEVPSERWGQSLSLINGGQLLVFGGQGACQEMSKDCLWIVNSETHAWTRLDGTGSAPTLRMGHTSVFSPADASVYIFGGSRKMRWFSDVYSFDTVTSSWTSISYTGTAPTVSYHSASVYRDEMYVFGGVHGHASDRIPDECNNDVYVFNFATKNWYRPIVSGELPSPRSGHTSVLSAREEKLYIFGGWDTPECFGDLFVFDLVLMEFAKLETTGDAPSPRSWHAAVMLPGDKMLVCGGFDGSEAKSDAYVLDLDTLAWSTVDNDELKTPRAGHSICVVQPAAERAEDAFLCIFGGGNNDGVFYNDLVTVPVSRLAWH